MTISFITNNDLVESSHLLPLNIDVNNTDQDSDSDLCSTASDVEVNHTDDVNDDFVQLNFNNDNSFYFYLNILFATEIELISTKFACDKK